MKQDAKFTEALQNWMNTPDDQKKWDEGAILLLQLSGNRIMYHNISVNPKGKADFIKGQLQKYLNFRLQQLTKDQVQEMQAKVDEIVKKVIKPNTEDTPSGKSAEFADFKAGKRADHDTLPEEIQALYVENLDLVHRMRELHLKLRSLSLNDATCPDSERYPFLQEIIKMDKKLHENWDTYDHYVIGTPTSVVPISEENATVPEVSTEDQESLDAATAEHQESLDAALVDKQEASPESQEAPKPEKKTVKTRKKTVSTAKRTTRKEAEKK